MKVVLGSTNVSKQRSILIAMKELEIDDVSIELVNVNSLVSSKPINDETLIGARNRNKNLYNYCIENIYTCHSMPWRSCNAKQFISNIRPVYFKLEHERIFLYMSAEGSCRTKQMLDC